ncbi:PilN domain-containing protein [Natranaerofaba carboxydovora]|uniref:PilN domain-containing protein n=1 Tax=Natranaerofaba carboxydovora TaxID=2742683 RepID=UPI001F13AA14|nr:PilN domain-containing protein [Natranaerofaba carboxydovora]
MYLEAENIKIENDLYDHQEISAAYLESEKMAIKAQSILDTNTRWSVILRELLEISPDSLIIEYYDASNAENLIIKGMSGTVKDIAQLKESLKEKPYYTNVLLNLIDKRVRSDNEVYYFELSARLTGANTR